MLQQNCLKYFLCSREIEACGEDRREAPRESRWLDSPSCSRTDGGGRDPEAQVPARPA